LATDKSIVATVARTLTACALPRYYLKQNYESNLSPASCDFGATCRFSSWWCAAARSWRHFL